MRVSDGFESSRRTFTGFCSRHFTLAATIVLILAAFNLCFRLDREVVTEWDESLYAISAAEAVAAGSWIGTTFLGELDYYNTKPPLNIWLIGASFKAFGPGLVSLRLPSVAAAWLTVLVLLLWGRRAFGAPTALLAGLVLSTTFGFIYVHAARSANTDALFTLLMLLIVVTMWGADRTPWRMLWLGPLVAAVFLLRGMAVLMPLLLVGAVLLLDWRRLGERWKPLLAASVLLAVPVAGWIVARWRIDEWRFIDRMFNYDFVARSSRALEGHTGTPLYYLNVLQKDQYDWLLAAVAALVLYPVSRVALKDALSPRPGRAYLLSIGAAWLGVTLVIPTLMRTKVAWYLNPFFPIFALLVAGAVAHGFTTGEAGTRRRRVLAGFVVLALAVAESKLIWYSYNMRDLGQSAQGLLLDERTQLAGRRVFRHRWPRAGRFVLEHVVGGEAVEVEDELAFMRKGATGDYILLSRDQLAYSRLPCFRTNGRFALCRYPD